MKFSYAAPTICLGKQKDADVVSVLDDPHDAMLVRPPSRGVPKKSSAIIAIAVILVSIPIPVLAQAGNKQDLSAPRGQHEAMRMVPARGSLAQTLDANKTRIGHQFRVKLSKTVHLDNGPELPAGTVLVGNIVDDDMQINGMSKLALRFTHANLKNGQVLPVKVTIVGVVTPGKLEDEDGDGFSDYQVPTNWTDGTLQVDQIDVVSGVDLHSKIASTNSGVFVSKKKDDVKLPAGSEIQMAIATGTTE